MIDGEFSPGDVIVGKIATVERFYVVLDPAYTSQGTGKLRMRGVGVVPGTARETGVQTTWWRSPSDLPRGYRVGTISELPVIERPEPGVIIDGAVPRTSFERINRLQDMLSMSFSDLPIDYGPVVEAVIAPEEDHAELEERLIEQANEWLVPNKRQMIVSGRDPGDLLLLPVNENDEPVDAEGAVWVE